MKKVAEEKDALLAHFSKGFVRHISIVSNERETKKKKVSNEHNYFSSLSLLQKQQQQIQIQIQIQNLTR